MRRGWAREGIQSNRDREPSNQWARLAAVARERASEQAAKALTAPDARAALPHHEQEAYLVKLAEVYEERSRDGVAAA